MKTYEVERKFLMKRVPNLEFQSVLNIEQYYLPDDGEWTDRVRRVQDIKKDSTEYVRTRKLKVGDLINEEDEFKITEDEFNSLKNISVSLVEKVRYITNIDGNKWEFDMFVNLCLILAESEFVFTGDISDLKIDKIENMEIPEVIKNDVILESTNIPELSNKSISILI